MVSGATKGEVKGNEKEKSSVHRVARRVLIFCRSGGGESVVLSKSEDEERDQEEQEEL
jgi:hypothetical protein